MVGILTAYEILTIFLSSLTIACPQKVVCFWGFLLTGELPHGNNKSVDP